MLSHLGDIDMNSMLRLSRADVAPFLLKACCTFIYKVDMMLFLGVGDGKGHDFNDEDLNIDVQKQARLEL